MGPIPLLLHRLLCCGVSAAALLRLTMKKVRTQVLLQLLLLPQRGKTILTLSTPTRTIRTENTATMRITMQQQRPPSLLGWSATATSATCPAIPAHPPLLLLLPPLLLLLIQTSPTLITSLCKCMNWWVKDILLRRLSRLCMQLAMM